MAAGVYRLTVQPSDAKVPVWRYMNFTKYVSLLDNQALFLPRIDLLGDPFEGTFSKGTPPAQPILSAGGLRSFVAVSDDSRSELRQLYRQLREWTYVSCWHANEFESAAMWRLYASTNEAVAIRTTFALLQEAFPEEAFIGLVNYIDFEREWVLETNTLWPYFYKRKSFEHEREVRVVLQDGGNGNAYPFRSNPEAGKLIPLKLESMLQETVVAPTAPPWFKDIVGRVTHRYGLSIPVRQSAMDMEPLY